MANSANFELLDMKPSEAAANPKATYRDSSESCLDVKSKSSWIRLLRRSWRS